ncbi:hypothetical protein H6F77_24730 [Microcoleus sp. FACHB-831]|uniref:hypothetical protein n=1 Tax=Microcoleus sp. FACHB-831 TaxID=2692827 RepID=UPI00168469AC|nr:hypothetical protein [Microcoleus sp. FACHB-831]MBD1924250.1 hypothetical protein [Microcoleus sp. FACHB-831]
MNYRLIAIKIIGLVYSLNSVAFAQDIDKSSPNRFGDYYSNDAPVKATLPLNSSLMAGSVWRVVSNNLNCRSTPGTNNRIIKKFNKDDVIQAEVGRGGSDEVLLNARDIAGKPWMPVRYERAKNSPDRMRCYVRANSRYITPYMRDR